jgi:hypothetical protein
MPRMRKYTEAQKARRAENLRRWRAQNRKRYRQSTRIWEARDGNAERMKQWRREWLARNRDRINALARARYAANPELGRLKLKQKRQRAGVKYRQQIKRSRVKMRSTPEGRIYHRIGQSIRSALRGAKRRCSWELILGYSREELRCYLESQFTAGMTWEKFLAGEIDIDHIRPRMTFSYSSMHDPQFKECWALSNLRPMWARDNRSRGASARWARDSTVVDLM